MSHFLRRLAIAWLCLSPLAIAAPAMASRIFPSSNLIKGSNSTVYWYDFGYDHRYLFPNIGTFLSWYPLSEFRRIATMRDSDVSAIPMTGTVTYRPGARLVKLRNDGKVYAVSQYGILHWLSNETVARQLYGANWNHLVDDMPDSIFNQYAQGDAIVQASDFQPGKEYDSVSNPGDNRLFPPPPGSNLEDNEGHRLQANQSNNNVYGSTAPPTGASTDFWSNFWPWSGNHGNDPSIPQSTTIPSIFPSPSNPTPVSTDNNFRGTLVIGLDRYNARAGETVTVSASLYQSNVDSQNLSLRIYNNANELIQLCHGTSYCGINIPVQANSGAYQTFYAQALSNSGQTILSQNQVALNVINPVPTPIPVSGGVVHLTYDLLGDSLNQGIHLTAQIDGNALPLGQQRLRIYHRTSHNLIQDCRGVQTCQATLWLGRIVQPTVLPYEAVATDNQGHDLPASDVDISLTAAPQLQGHADLQLDRTDVERSGSVTLQATVDHVSVDSQHIHIHLYQVGRNQPLQTCSASLNCSTAFSPVGTPSQTEFHFYALVDDDSGRELLPAFSPTLTIHGRTLGAVSLHYSPSHPALDSVITITAELNASPQAIDVASVHSMIYDQRSSDPIGSCSGTSNCQIDYLVDDSVFSTNLYAVFVDDRGHRVQSDLVPLTGN